MTTLDRKTQLVRDGSLVSSDLDGETVMMSLDTSRYYGLNRVGSRIWELLEQPTSMAQLCATLQREYDVAPEQCELEVLALAQKLLQENLIRVV